MRALNVNIFYQKKSPVPKDRRLPGSRLSAPVEEAFELAAANGMLQLPHRFRLDLANALARHLEDSAHLFERIGVAVAEAVAQLDNFALAVGQRLQDMLDLVLEHF